MGKRILVVDDEKNIRLMLDQALSGAGHTVVTAIDGEHALVKFQESQPDLVLLDMKMPGLDGIEVLRRLRDVAPHTPVIMITAHASVETAVETMKLGASDYLRKPFTPDEIRSTVAKVLARTAQPALSPDRSAGVAALMERAKLLLRQRDFEQAEEALHQASAMDPSNAGVLTLLGVAKELAGRIEEAGHYYRAALSFEPSYRPAIENLTRVTNFRYFPDAVEANLEPTTPTKDE